ncbi:2075_t:CDS:1, partial [Gigaspora rosea]
QTNSNIQHSLSSFCETPWYSLAKMCLGISVYEDGFKHCAIKSFCSDAPTISENLQIIINDKFHFAYNYELQQVLLPIVNAIGTLKAHTSTLADIFIQLLIVEMQL